MCIYIAGLCAKLPNCVEGPLCLRFYQTILETSHVPKSCTFGLLRISLNHVLYHVSWAKLHRPTDLLYSEPTLTSICLPTLAFLEPIAYICVVELGHRWFRPWPIASSSPSYHVHEWLIDNFTRKSMFHEIWLKIQPFLWRKWVWKCSCKMAPILSLHGWAHLNLQVDALVAVSLAVNGSYFYRNWPFYYPGMSHFLKFPSTLCHRVIHWYIDIPVLLLW